MYSHQLRRKEDKQQSGRLDKHKGIQYAIVGRLGMREEYRTPVIGGHFEM